MGKGSTDGTLVQFDLEHGIAVEPGRTLVRGLHNPLGVAVGPDGLVYVSETGLGGHRAINVYKIIGRDAQRVRKLTFGPGVNAPSPEYVAVDAQDYLYASMDFRNIAVFRPAEDGYVANPHYLYNTDGAMAISTDVLGDVYQPTGDHLYVHLGRHGKPARMGTKPVTLRSPGAWITQSKGDELFIAPRGLSRNWDSVSVIPIHAWGKVNVTRSLVLQQGCWVRLQSDGFAIAVAGDFLYETCGYTSKSNEYIRGVWTFPSKGSGNVRALHFAKAPSWTPGDIAVGP